MKIKNKGFTLVEVLVSLTIVGALVLFATTKQKDNLTEAKLTQIKSDISTMEKESKQKSLLSETQTTATKIDYSEIEDTKFYDKTGKLAVLPKGNYTNIDSKTLGVETTLTGNFIKSENNEIYYTPKIEKIKEDIDENNKEVVSVALKDNTPEELEKAIKNTPKGKVAVYFTVDDNSKAFYGEKETLFYVPKDKKVALRVPIVLNSVQEWTPRYVENQNNNEKYATKQISKQGGKIIAKYNDNTELKYNGEPTKSLLVGGILYPVEGQKTIRTQLKLNKDVFTRYKNPTITFIHTNKLTKEKRNLKLGFEDAGNNTYKVKILENEWWKETKDLNKEDSYTTTSRGKTIRGIRTGFSKDAGDIYTLWLDVPDNLNGLNLGDRIRIKQEDDLSRLCVPLDLGVYYKK